MIWTEPALDDLDEIAAFIALDDPQAATAFVQKVLGAVERLQLHPQSGRKVPELHGTNYRELIVAPCRIVYRVDGSDIYLVYVFRGERQLRRNRLR
ncbi:MAG: type II toxin-antitoxin system RelE/ParE family toxin [Deltaproteobacteria bacterium]|nr:type II toxin-antitoxin system RelE/ParE family toxin [Deltaproteobacteria bacterium]